MQTAAQTKEELVREFRTREILDAAQRVVAEVGVREASIERIARAAGVSKGTVYVYFRSKEELLVQATEQSFLTFMDELGRALDGTRDTREQLDAMVRASFDFAARTDGLLRPLLEPGGLAPDHLSDLNARLAERREAFERRIEDVVRDGIARGELRDVSPRRAARALTGSLRAAAIDGIATAPAAERAAEAAEIVNLWLDGVSKRP